MRRSAPARCGRLCLVLLLVACATTSVPAAGAVASDAWITTRVKMLLLLSPEVDGTKIHVDSDGGRVTLFGIASAAAEKHGAERIAEQVVGVRTVRNLIAVVPATRQPAVERSDHTLRENVGLALREDPVLSSSDIHVESVDAGTVVLGGRAVSLSELRRALSVARRITGVRRVASVVESPSELSDAETWGDAMAAPEQHNAARDNWLTAAVKGRLIADDRVPAQDVSVDTEDGVVILFGTVPSDAAKRQAQIIAASVPGVESVQNEILVRHSSESSDTGR